MSADYSLKLVRDSRLNDITDKLEVACAQGAAQNTFQQFPSTSASTSTLTFQVQPPSESVIVDRNVLIQARVKFSINVGSATSQGNVPVGDRVFNYGVGDSFQAFPLNSLFTTTTVTINNTSVSINGQDVVPALLHLMDEEDLQGYKGMTPTLIDKFTNYRDAIVCDNNNPMGGYQLAGYNRHLLPRGCHPLHSLLIERSIAGVLQDNSPVSTGLDNYWVITIEADFTEPIFLSPFLVHSKYNEAGILGVNNMNFVMNIDSQCRRLWSTAMPNAVAPNPAIPYSLSLDPTTPFSNARLLFNMLTSQSVDLVPARNILPYIDYSRFISASPNLPTIASGASQDITINNLQLNQIPDRLIIFARKRLSDQTPRDANCFFVINSISIQFNVASGLLSSATQQDLWRLSVASGSKQSWYEFSGRAQYYSANPVVTDVFATQTIYSTTGSILMLNPAEHLSLPEYLSNGSLGQFSFQMRINLTNISNDLISPEVVVITCNSGIFSTIAGSSSVQTALLTKQFVIETATQEGKNAISSNDYMRMRGGALSDQISSAFKHLPLVKKYLCDRSGGCVGGARSGGMLLPPKHKKLEALVM